MSVRAPNASKLVPAFAASVTDRLHPIYASQEGKLGGRADLAIAAGKDVSGVSTVLGVRASF